MDAKQIRRTVIIAFLYFVGTVSGFLVSARYFSISDITGVGQLFFDALLFPTVIIGFWITITEFRKSQIVPALKLLWRGDMAIDLEGDCLVLKTSQHNIKTFFLMLFLKNDGEAIATWYRLTFDIPRELARPNSDSHTVRWHRGEANCWNSSVNTEMTRHEFKSSGQYALYPDEEIHIATLEVQVFPQVAYPNRVYIRHSVVTDKTRIQHGVCKIKIRPEDFAR